jgi:phosphonoacetaldehyde hydrolase
MEKALEFHSMRDYKCPVKGVIFDWAGTTVDFGCQAPAMVFKQVFLEEGVEITEEEVRLPMGLHKRDHITTISQMKRVAIEWKKVHGKVCDEDDIERMFNNFIPKQLEMIPKYTDLIPGVLEAQEYLRSMDIKIGTTTGYNNAMMDILVPLAKEQGYDPDFVVCATDVANARPAPWMAFKNAEEFNIYPMSSMIKIGDTVADIEEGLNAGMWSVGVILSSNELGLTESQLELLSKKDLDERCQLVKDKMYKAGAHFVITSLNEIEDLVKNVQNLLKQGERP